ncbi:MAG: diguanylate cyclase [Gammaproteobacteria bacterium]|nr:diguanylate cyclase [Gammaproteobacteria bacterium]MEA3142008.1 diguanylate cyclase [Gammaproteobacteria bacterium]
MSDNVDWKQKYRDSLIEMEAEEVRWRQVEQVLRRLVGRLCAAGMGVNPKLDDELIGLAAANRRNAEAHELARLADSLTSTVVAVDAVSPIPTITFAATDTHTRLAVKALLERLPASEASASAAQALIAELATAKNDVAVAGIITRAADLVHERGEQLARERQQTGAILAEVTKRLEEMAGYLSDSKHADRSHFDDTQSYNETVMTQVRALSEEAGSAGELGVLQSLVNARLQRVVEHVGNFRAREELRLVEVTGRAERMRSRILELEREGAELHSKLDSEKQGARIDPLTGIANRKSFEERFAQEIGKKPSSESPVVMLLWDLDSFKFVNDSYGHRAGDRVLQSVAACFTAVARQDDFVARIGGEEFVVLLKGAKIPEALVIANEVRSAVEALRFHFRGTPVRVTVSCGLTELQGQDAAGAAFERADLALYRAKHGGKNLCVAA